MASTSTQNVFFLYMGLQKQSEIKYLHLPTNIIASKDHIQLCSSIEPTIICTTTGPQEE